MDGYHCDARHAQTTPQDVEVSLVVPAFNESACIRGVIEEALAVLQGLDAPFEVILVDDGSTDGTADAASALQPAHPTLRVLVLSPNCGQSAAFGAGFRHCRGRVALLMDGDGQNDPADIPRLLEGLREHDACCGYRTGRRDTWSKRVGSRLANRVRQAILHDGIIDTGCSLKAIRTEFLRDLPMNLRGMHRFLPALLRMRGARISQVPVRHRARSGGRSKYTNLGRLAETVWDLWAVRWMQKRHRQVTLASGGGEF